MASYIEAVRLGVDIIEFDVLTTVDGVVFCHHDALIEKTGEQQAALPYSSCSKILEAKAEVSGVTEWVACTSCLGFLFDLYCHLPST